MEAVFHDQRVDADIDEESRQGERVGPMPLHREVGRHRHPDDRRAEYGSTDKSAVTAHQRRGKLEPPEHEPAER